MWTPEEWRRKGAECDEIRACKLGWDVTDFGSGEFNRRGLTLFCVRNGRQGEPNGKPYALNLFNNMIYTHTAQGCGGRPASTCTGS